MATHWRETELKFKRRDLKSLVSHSEENRINYPLSYFITKNIHGHLTTQKGPLDKNQIKIQTKSFEGLAVLGLFISWHFEKSTWHVLRNPL